MRGGLPLEWPYNRGNTVPHRGLHGHDVCQLFVAGRWFSLGTPVSSTKETDCQNITEILLKVALNTMTLTPVLHNFALFLAFFYNLLKTLL